MIIEVGAPLRKLVVFVLATSLFFAGNQAASWADEPDLEYVDCSAGGFITIQDSVVVSNDLCAGSVEIPLYVSEVGNLAFFSALGLDSVTFESDSALETIGAGAFQSSGLKEISIPASVTLIGEEAFAETSTLVSVSFAYNSTLQTIGNGAFRASGLREVAVPSSVNLIDSKAFAETADLGFVSFLSDSALETIGEEAFQLSGLTDITIPSSVMTIGSRAFADTSNLVSIAFLGNAPAVGDDVFNGVSATSASILPQATGFGPAEWSAIPVFFAGTINCSTSGYVVVVDNVIINNVECAGDLEIPSYVVGIAERAFDQSTLLQSIFFSVQSNFSVIEPYAFANSSLVAITIPSSTSLIMEYAFENTPNLSSVSFDPDSRLESIGTGVFSGSKLAQFSAPSSITSIGEKAFYEASALTIVAFDPDSKLESIGDSAFKSSGLMEITIPRSVTSIGEQAFADTVDLLAVVFQEGSQVATIGNGAFQDAFMLMSVTIPPSVVSIGDQAFANTVDLTELLFDLADSKLTSIGNGSFQDASALTSVIFPASVTSIGDQAFANTSNLVDVTFDAGLGETGSALQSIGVGAFSDSGITQIDIPTSVTSIGDQAFADTSDLILVSIGAESKLEVIGVGAFNASGLEEFTIPASVTSIGDNAFSNLPFLRQFIVDPGNTEFESDSGVLFTAGQSRLIQYPLGYESDPELTEFLYTVPESVVEIGSYAFSGGFNVIEIEFSDDSALETIGFSAFNRSQISQITIPASVTTIGEQAFANTLSLETITFSPDSALEKIENSVFENSSISEVSIPESVTEIGASSFNSSSLTEITIPASIAAIGEQAFANTTNLESITFASDIVMEKIENGTFLRSAITSIVIPDGVMSIGSGAFSDTSELTEVTIPSSVETIGSDAFSLTPSLQRLYFLGDAPTLESDFDDSSTAVAYKRPTAEGFDAEPTWGGLSVSNGVFDLSFNSQGGSAVASKTLFFGKPIPLAPTSPTRSQHTFLGWSETATGAIIRFPYTPSVFGDKTLYAKWQSNRATLDLKKPKPSISGKAISSKKGTNKLTVKPGTWIGVPKPVIAYAWYSCTTQVKTMTQTIPKTCKPIAKATKNTLPVISAYKGKFLAVKVTGTSRGTAPTFYLTVSTAKVK